MPGTVLMLEIKHLKETDKNPCLPGAQVLGDGRTQDVSGNQMGGVRVAPSSWRVRKGLDVNLSSEGSKGPNHQGI